LALQKTFSLGNNNPEGGKATLIAPQDFQEEFLWPKRSFPETFVTKTAGGFLQKKALCLETFIFVGPTEGFQKDVPNRGHSSFVGKRPLPTDPKQIGRLFPHKRSFSAEKPPSGRGLPPKDPLKKHH